MQSPTIQKNHKEQLLKTFIPLKEEFENFNQSFGQTESAKIWKRIDSYIKEYSKEKGYKMVLGSFNGDRTVLYSDESINITPELITYINKRYEGKK
ncbi:OmpH family outer membrane protein [Flavobacterium oreochromis]|uniref:OmpH family outer membrane protein n=1 Tax=Flavobacterium oreochromis TaxID=2906078 RepID=UPI001CE5ADAD|nr:OmpH family outer membrane protein [Flavobacterium oreochromis]QYS87789.1 OmpH family outer membrane protein [Flavobacterium oreochromis]